MDDGCEVMGGLNLAMQLDSQKKYFNVLIIRRNLSKNRLLPEQAS